MRPGALLPYERALATTEPLALHAEDGRTFTLDLSRWREPVDAADETVLDACVGPTLDVGCGPGRFVSSLVQRGIPTLGVDIAATAVALTQRRGLPALRRSVFSPLPGEGRWGTVLLMDGNIGIDGNPARLLRRARQLVGHHGRVLVETHRDHHVDEVLSVRFSVGGTPVGPEFSWAHVGLKAVRGYAIVAGYSKSEVWSAGGRTFIALMC